MNPFAWQINGYDVIGFCRSLVLDEAVVLLHRRNGEGHNFATALYMGASVKTGDLHHRREFGSDRIAAEADFIERADLSSVPF